MKRFVLGGYCALVTFALTVCSGDPSANDVETCTGYADWRVSEYVLPYPAGASFKVIQANCSPAGNGHRGANKFGYDFDMPIGTQFLATRAGRVLAVEQSHFDGEVAATGLDNYIVIRHGDGTAGLYGHLTRNGALVGVGDSVQQGIPIGRSGNTGNTGNIPHLHFSLQACDPVTGGSQACPTVPSTFRNTEANPSGLVLNHSYVALPLTP